MARVIEPIGMMALCLRRGIPAAAAKIITTDGRPSSSSSAANKSKQAADIKRLRKENKDIFGELLETKYDKIKREKKHAKNVKKGFQERTAVARNAESFDEKNIANSNVPELDTEGTTSLIKSVIGDRDIGQQVEIDWSLKNFPQRYKIIRRSNPEYTVHSFEQVKGPSGQFKIIRGNQLETSSGLSSKEIQQLPRMNQVYDSFQESVDILPSFEVKLVRKDVNSIATATQGVQRPTSGQFPEIQSQNKEIGDIINKETSTFNGKTTYSSHDEGDKSCPTPLLSVDPHMDQFPYDNPEKKIGNLTSAETTQEDEIISFPFPTTHPHIRIRNSQEPVDGGESQQQQKLRIPSVSKILNATMSPKQVEILKKWEEKMIAKLGEQGFLRYKEDLFLNGKRVHANIHSLLSGKPKDELEIPDPIAGHWESLQSILPQIERVRALESHVFHPKLNYCGIVDCVAMFRDKLVVIDWKTSEKPKPHLSMTYDTPLQIAAYVGALNYDPNYSLKIHAGLVVVAYQDGKDCQTYFLNSSQIDSYWKQWLKRLKLYQSQQLPLGQ